MESKVDPLLYYLKDTYSNYKILDVTKSINNKSYKQYTGNTALDEKVIIVIRYEKISELIFKAYETLGHKNMKYSIIYKGNYLTLPDVSDTSKELITKLIGDKNPECSICDNKIIANATSCKKCNYNVCQACVYKLMSITRKLDRTKCHNCKEPLEWISPCGTPTGSLRSALRANKVIL